MKIMIDNFDKFKWDFKEGEFYFLQVIKRKKIGDDLISLGITPRKSLTLCNVMNNIDKEFRKSFILGYFDGDGSIYVDSKRHKSTISIRGTNELLSGILNELGLDLRVRKYDSTYTITIGSKSGISIFKTIYGKTDFYLYRKFVKINNPTLLFYKNKNAIENN